MKSRKKRKKSGSRLITKNFPLYQRVFPSSVNVINRLLPPIRHRLCEHSLGNFNSFLRAVNSILSDCAILRGVAVHFKCSYSIQRCFLWKYLAVLVTLPPPGPQDPIDCLTVSGSAAAYLHTAVSLHRIVYSSCSCSRLIAGHRVWHVHGQERGSGGCRHHGRQESTVTWIVRGTVSSSSCTVFGIVATVITWNNFQCDYDFLFQPSHTFK